MEVPVKAMLLLLLLLAIVAFFSFQETDVGPYWKGRLPGVRTALKEGRFRDAITAAAAADPLETKRLFNQNSTPLGEVPRIVPKELAQYAPGARDTASSTEQPADSTPIPESVLEIE